MDWNTIKAGLARLLPVIKVIARLTPTKVDDAAVLFLETLLASDGSAVAPVVAATPRA
jgi:hypothetical protein